MSATLTTFVAPKPNKTLIRFLTPVNRLFNLHGVPILKDLPLFRRIPGLRGLTNIREIDFPAADIARLREVENKDTAAFLAPNHPEFFTDWMVDKEVMSHLDVTPGCWATHTVVNGMGKWGQKFWLANNLIAQIPGEGGAEGKAHSVELAKRGDGVLLHPEGTVHWVADQVGPLFSGVLDMANTAATDLAAGGSDRPVYVAPLIYKYMFMKDETKNLHSALGYVETSLDLPSGAAEPCPALRLRQVYLHLTDRVAQRHDVTLPDGSFWERRAALISNLTARLVDVIDTKTDAKGSPYDSAEAVLKQHGRVKRSGVEMPQWSGKVARDLRELLNLQPWMYPGGTVTQEQIAERIQRLRLDWLRKRLSDKIHAFIPQPVGPRRGYIRLVEPLTISTGQDGASALDLQTRMQRRLDDLNAEISPHQKGEIRANPFDG